MAVSIRKTDSWNKMRELKQTVLPENKEVVWHYEYLRATLSERDVKFEKKLPVFQDVKDQLVDDIIGPWVKSLSLACRF